MEKIFVPSEQLEEFNSIFRKDVIYDNIKIHKKPGHLQKMHFWENHRGVCITLSGHLPLSGNIWTTLKD